ncbi:MULTISPECIES: TetR/AcrR family transcriptional regulator [unclassified Lentilitoribacter]|jgi:TetR/AcrR family transcriptional repressor of nem operon|uniref:TetR/AcrR family transcriptional regulator n=1 Tax=unclassified Lentilitoribacter TaxID=2647570 RepID=UPI0013A6D5F2|nr:TetR/AcrR family transcriptional regulator [Lentilitoribacter sp. Alg239-R112]
MNKRDEILDVTEALIRERGYNAVSAREVAKATNIKSSSVHYHFPNKSDMVSAVVDRYTKNFLDALGAPEQFSDAGRADVVSHYVTAFRAALTDKNRVCLCAILGAETGGLPVEVVDGTRDFFARNIKWLSDAIESTYDQVESDHKQSTLSQATHILACLEGAMIVSRTMGDIDYFDRSANLL